MPPDVRVAVEEAHRAHWAAVLARTARTTRDLALAEACTRGAYGEARTAWSRGGVPDDPGTWLTRSAADRAGQVPPGERPAARTLPPLAIEERPPDHAPGADDALQLVFACCHPALAAEARVTLALHLVCGLSTAEVARALIVPERTVVSRIERATAKIATTHLPFRVPADRDLPERLGVVLDLVHRLFTSGHTAPGGERLLRPLLVDNALRMGRLLHSLLPGDPAVAGLLALMLLLDARPDGRTTVTGDLLLLSEQDRSPSDPALVEEGAALLAESLALSQGRTPSRYAVEAAILAQHAAAPSWEATDWAAVVRLHDVLLRLCPTPVVRLNRVAAVAHRDGPDAGLDALAPLLDDPPLAVYPYLTETRADLLARAGRVDDAVAAYEQALELTDNGPERRHLQARLHDLGNPQQTHL